MTNVTEKVKNVYHSLAKEGDYKTASYLLRKLINRQGRETKSLPIMLKSDSDWKLANLFDENHNGFYYSIQ